MSWRWRGTTRAGGVMRDMMGVGKGSRWVQGELSHTSWANRKTTPPAVSFCFCLLHFFLQLIGGEGSLETFCVFRVFVWEKAVCSRSMSCLLCLFFRRALPLFLSSYSLQVLSKVLLCMLPCDWPRQGASRSCFLFFLFGRAWIPIAVLPEVERVTTILKKLNYGIKNASLPSPSWPDFTVDPGCFASMGNWLPSIL